MQSHGPWKSCKFVAFPELKPPTALLEMFQFEQYYFQLTVTYLKQKAALNQGRFATRYRVFYYFVPSALNWERYAQRLS
jgi:hypothetical protein